MQPTEGLSVARRPLDIEDYIDVLRRHRGWIFGPFLLCLVASVVVSYLWPDTYISKGSIKVSPQQLPTSLVPAVMTQDMVDRITSMYQTITSNSSLTEIITSNDLYLKERSRAPLEDVRDEMRKSINLDFLGPQNANANRAPAFQISFSYPNRRLAQKVVEALMGKFLEENSRSESNSAFQNAQFLKDQTESAKKELDEVEGQLAAYKSENNGRLPEQRTENYQKLQTLQTAAGNLTSRISQLQSDSLIREGELRFMKTQQDERAQVQPQITAQQQAKSERRLLAEHEVETLTNGLRLLQKRYQDSFPDVKSEKAALETAQQRLDQIIKEDAETAKKETAPEKPTVTEASLKQTQEREASAYAIQTAINLDTSQMDEANKQLKGVSEEIKALQARLNSVPQSEKDYDDLLRERALKNEKYEEYTKSLAKGQVTLDMENRKQGEQLEVLNPASNPETPASPNHLLWVGIGAAVGLLLGIVIAGGREMKDTALKNMKDVRAYTQMPILGSIPLLENDFVVRRRRRLAWLGWTTACLASIILMAGSVVFYYSSKS